MSICLYALVKRTVGSRQRGEQCLEAGDIRIDPGVVREFLHLLQRLGRKVGAARLPEQPGDEDGFRLSGFAEMVLVDGKHFVPQSENWGMTGRTLLEIRPRTKQAHPWDTPPTDVTGVKAGLLACGS